MDKKLIVVLTVSQHDWGQILRRIPIDGQVVHINCDNGQISTDPIAATRVMVIAFVAPIQQDRDEVTNLLLQFINQYTEYDKVVGLHGRTYNFTVNCIDRNRLTDIPLNDEECTTAVPCPYSHLLEALLQKKPNPQQVQQYFDQLFDNLKTEKKLIKRIAVLKYRLAFLFLPIDIDAQGFIEAKGDEQYWSNEGNPYTNEWLNSLLERARQLADVGQVVSEVVAKASNDERRNRICQSWKEVTSLLPDNKPPDAITQLIEELGKVGSVDLEELKCHWEQFHNWFVSLCEAMDKLRDEVEKLEQAK